MEIAGAFSDLDPNGDTIQLISVADQVFSYSRLAVYGADGAPLAAWLDSSPEGGARIAIDTAGAVWPVTVDPVLEAGWIRDDSNYNYARFGWSLVSGNVNADSYTDALVGAPNYSGQDGGVWLYLAASNGTGLSSATLSSPKIGPDLSELGYSMAWLGDVAGTGVMHVVIGAPGLTNHTGAVYVYKVTSTGLGAIVWTKGGPAANSRFGSAVARVGDLNGDTRPEILVGAPSYDNPEDSEGQRVSLYRAAPDRLSERSPVVYPGGLRRRRLRRVRRHHRHEC